MLTRSPLRECVVLRRMSTDGHTRLLTVSVYSCSNYPFGFFNAYGNAARRDSIDYAVHVGDYM